MRQADVPIAQGRRPTGAIRGVGVSEVFCRRRRHELGGPEGLTRSAFVFALGS